MSCCKSSSSPVYVDSSSEEEYVWDEDEDIDMVILLDMEKNKQPKHGGSVFREVIRRRR